MFGWCPPESFKFTPMFHHKNFSNNRNMEGCTVVQDRLVYVSVSCLWKSWRGLKREESVLVKQSAKQAQGQISLPLSLFLLRLLLLAFTLRPRTLPVPPVFISSCSTLHTQLVLISGRWWWVGIRPVPLAGKLHTHHTVVTNREKPHQTSSSAAPVRQYISVDVQILCMFCRAKS